MSILLALPNHYEDYVYVGGFAGQNHGELGFVSAVGYIECHRNRSNLGGVVGTNFGSMINAILAVHFSKAKGRNSRLQ